MQFFQSRAEKTIAQNLAFRAGLREIEKAETNASQQIDKLAEYGRKAQDYGDTRGYEVACAVIEKILKFKKAALRQRISLEGQQFLKTQANAMAGFQKATVAFSAAIDGLFKELNFTSMVHKSARASARAEQMQESMDLIMDEMLAGLGANDVPTVSRDEVEGIIKGSNKASHLTQLDSLKALRQEISDLKGTIKAD
jgi:hypothetical protein